MYTAQLFTCEFIYLIQYIQYCRVIDVTTDSYRVRLMTAECHRRCRTLHDGRRRTATGAAETTEDQQLAAFRDRKPPPRQLNSYNYPSPSHSCENIPLKIHDVLRSLCGPFLSAKSEIYDVKLSLVVYV